MTISKLHELTAELIARGKGNKSVCVMKDTFTHPLEADGCTILPVESAEFMSYHIMDDDGGVTDEHKAALVLSGVEAKP